MIAKLLSYPKTLIIIAVLALIGGGWLFVNGLVKKNAAQAVIISQQETTIATQSSQITELELDAVQKQARQTALDAVNKIKDRERQNKLIITNKNRGGRLQNALSKKGNLTIDIINRATADSLQELQRATDNPIR